MPDWQAEAIILSVRPHGEGSAVISVLTADYGPVSYTHLTLPTILRV